jgi:Fe-S-cluster containining protein
VIPCGSGCSACCHGPFDVSVADVALLRDGLAKLDAPARADVLARARALLARAVEVEPAWRPPHAVEAIGEERFDAVCDALAGAPCPLLDDAGRCRVYEDRPLVCRLIGLPMRTPAGRTIENCCPIVDHFPGYAALEPVEFDLEGFEAEERACMSEAAQALFGHEAYAGYHTFIAGALVALAQRSEERPSCP